MVFYEVIFLVYKYADYLLTRFLSRIFCPFALSFCIIAIALIAEAKAQSEYPNTKKIQQKKTTGISIGSNKATTVYPKLKLDSGYNSNINASRIGTDGGFKLKVMPSFELFSDFTPHSFAANGSASYDFYAATANKSKYSVNLDLSARIRLAQGLSIIPFWGAGITHESSEQGYVAENAAGNVRKKRFQSGLTVSKSLDKFNLSTSAYYLFNDFDDTTTNTGETIEQDPRDVKIVNGIVRIGYRIIPQVGFFTQIGYANYNYVNLSSFALDLDFNRTDYLFGTSLKLANTLNGYLALGYSRAKYKKVLEETEDKGGLTYKINLQYNASPKVRTKLLADSTISSTTAIDSLSKTINSVSLATEYDLTKKITISPSFLYELTSYSKFQGSDKKYTVGAQASHRIFDNLDIGVSYSFTKAVFVLSYLDYKSHYIGSFIDMSY